MSFLGVWVFEKPALTQIGHLHCSSCLTLISDASPFFDMITGVFAAG